MEDPGAGRGYKQAFVQPVKINVQRGSEERGVTPEVHVCLFVGWENTERNL